MCGLGSILCEVDLPKAIEFLTAGSVSAGSCHWRLNFERWADHGLGEVRATPRKDTALFRANWTRILRDRVYVVEDEGKYHGLVVGQTLSRPGALRVKCEDDAQRSQQSAVRAVLAERERTPTTQMRQALAAIKENVDTRLRVCPPASMSTWPIGPKNAHGWRAGAIVPATFQPACSGDIPICHQKTFEKSFERHRKSLLERRWNTHPSYRPCR